MKFLIHSLIFRGPSNVNRDDVGRPKSVEIGGFTRLRNASQNLKAAWRAVLSLLFVGLTATRTRSIGRMVKDKLMERGVDEKKAHDHALKVVNSFKKNQSESDEKSSDNGGAKKNGKKTKKDPFEMEILALLPEEMRLVENLIAKIAEGYEPVDDDYSFLSIGKAVDTALWGRMVASHQNYSVDAAMTVGHAFTVHPVEIQDDYFRAVDDLTKNDDKSSAHLGNRSFGAGLYYQFMTLDYNLLVSNLQGDEALAKKVLRELIRVIGTVSPSGCRTTMADGEAFATYLMIEKTEDAPRSLAQAFVDPTPANDVAAAISALESHKSRMDKCYDYQTETVKMNQTTGDGSIKELQDFIGR